jgi:septal ring factor EnvC (AmiA/AmiB activator)
MKNLIAKNLLGVVIIVLFTLCCGMLQAASKHDIFETSQKIKTLKKQIDQAYVELRKLNEEGGEHAQEKAQLLMAEIREMKSELSVLEQSLENMKNGGSKLRGVGAAPQASSVRHDSQANPDYSDRQ